MDVRSARGGGVAELLRLALPMVVSRAGLAAMGIADAVMVSRYGADQFATLSLADGTLGRVVDVFAAYVLGGLILVPRAFGSGDIAGCVRIWRRSIVPALGLGILGACIGLFGTPIFHLLGQRAALAEHAGSVAAILGVGYIAALLALTAAVFLEGMKRPTLVAVSVLGANLLNVGLNWLLIGGHGGLPALGAIGSAYSTTIVRFGLGIVLVACAWNVRTVGTAATLVVSAPDPPRLQEHLGLANAAVTGVMLVLTSSLLVFAGWISPLALAVLAAIFSLNAPMMLVALGVADATGIRIAAGAEHGESRRVIATSLLVMAGGLLACAAIWVAFPNALATLFTHDRAMHKGFAGLIPLAGGLLLLDGLCFVTVSALRGMRDVVWPTAIEIVTMAGLVPLAAGLAFGFALGVRGLVVAAVVSATCRLALLLSRFGWLTKPDARLTFPVATS